MQAIALVPRTLKEQGTRYSPSTAALPNDEIWRDAIGFYRLEVPPPPVHAPHCIRCDVLSAEEQIGLAQRRIDKCNAEIKESRTRQSNYKRNSPQWRVLQGTVKSIEEEISQEQRYIQSLGGYPASSDATPSHKPRTPVSTPEYASINELEQFVRQWVFSAEYPDQGLEEIKAKTPEGKQLLKSLGALIEVPCRVADLRQACHNVRSALGGSANASGYAQSACSTNASLALSQLSSQGHQSSVTHKVLSVAGSEMPNAPADDEPTSPDLTADLVSHTVEAVVVQPTGFDYDSLDSETRNVVQQYTEQIKERLRRTARDILEIGEKLAEVKEQLGHGKYGDWLKAEFDWDERTARRFLSVATVFKTDNLSDLTIAPSALYLLAAPSTPTEARQQILDRAKQGEVINYGLAKKVVAETKTGLQEAKRLVLHAGDWVEVHSEQTDQWNGLRGQVVESADDQGQFGIDLSESSGQSEAQCLRFGVQELIKVPAPIPYRVGEIVLIKCDPRFGAALRYRSATPEQRQHSGCWGIVREVLEVTASVAVSGELVHYPPQDLDWVDAPDDSLKDVCDRVTRLWSVPDLPAAAQHLLRTFYQQKLVFSQGDLDVLQAIKQLYF